MSEFQKFVSYINLYQNRQKIKNVGFAKIEKKNSLCMLRLQLKNCNLTGISCPVYLLKIRNELVEKIEIGKLPFSNGNGTGQFYFQEQMLSAYSCLWKEICGFLMEPSEHILFISQWNDEQIMEKKFVMATDQTVEITNIQATEDTQNTAETSNIQTTEDTQNTAETVDIQATENLQDTIETVNIQATEDTQNMAETINIQTTEDTQDTADTIHTPAMADTLKTVETTNIQISQENCPENMQNTKELSSKECFVYTEDTCTEKHMSLTPQQKWQLLMETYPTMTPFPGKEHIHCVRIELKDLRIFPKHFRYLGNNSFLLHGFFNYRYLLLGNVVTPNQTRYFLGIPGIFQPQEKVMADLFGFPEFISEKNTSQKINSFGYWCHFLEEDALSE